MMILSTGQKNNTPAKAAGFTLLELIAVMLVIATILAMAAPSLRGFFASKKTDGVARYLLAMTRYARSQAIAEGRDYWLQIDIDKQICSINIAGDTDEQETRNDLCRPYTLPQGITIDVENVSTASGIVELHFSPNGACTPATIWITGRQDDTYRVRSYSPTELYAISREARW